MNKWLPGVAATLFVAGSASLWHLSGETADAKRRLTHIEKQQDRDREESRADQKEIKTDVKQVANDVQQIKILLESMKRERGGR